LSIHHVLRIWYTTCIIPTAATAAVVAVVAVVIICPTPGAVSIAAFALVLDVMISVNPKYVMQTFK